MNDVLYGVPISKCSLSEISLLFILYSAHLQRLKAGINNLVKPTPCKWLLHLFEYVGRIEVSFIITSINLYWPLVILTVNPLAA